MKTSHAFILLTTSLTLCEKPITKPISPERQTRLNKLLKDKITLGEFKKMRILIIKGAAINTQDSTGDTALMEAVGQGNPSMALWLLQRGADPNICDNQNKSPLEWTCFDKCSDENNEDRNDEYGSPQDYRKCAELLVQYGAQPTDGFMQFGHIRTFKNNSYVRF